jgi:hypothetical protein
MILVKRDEPSDRALYQLNKGLVPPVLRELLSVVGSDHA